MGGRMWGDGEKMWKRMFLIYERKEENNYQGMETRPNEKERERDMKRMDLYNKIGLKNRIDNMTSIYAVEIN